MSGLATLLLYLAFLVLVVLHVLFAFRELNRTQKRLRAEEKAAEKKEPMGASAEKLPASPEIEAELKKRAKAEERNRDEARREKAAKLLDEKAKQPNAPWTLKVARVFEPPATARVRGLSRLKSGGRIGLAPIYSYTFEEDRKAAKAPLQAFAAGVDRLQNKLRYLVSIQVVRFEVLPPAVKVTTNRRAKLLRWLFGFDAVLWGSYVSTDPPLIAMQIETARSKPKDEEDAWSRIWPKLDIFKELDQIENEGIIVDQEDMLDAYVAVAMALVHALNARDIRRGGLLTKELDRLRLYNRSNRNAIITTLVEDGLFAVPAVPLRRNTESETVAEGSSPLRLMRSNFSSSPTAKKVLTDVAARWLGWQLSPWTSRDEGYPTEFLEHVALRCTELEPEDSGNYYRLAAVRLLLGKTEEARKAIEVAGARDLLVRTIAAISLLTRARVAMMDLDKSYGEREQNEAVCAIYVARALAHSGEEERGELAEEFKKKLILPSSCGSCEQHRKRAQQV